MIILIARCRKLATLLLAVLSTCFVIIPDSRLFSQDSVTPPQLPETEDPAPQIDVLTKGPMHEAFAVVHQADPQPSIVIANEPPPPIEEIPPEFQPEGDNVQWIPGYWAWYEDESDFIWISGLWRDVPPNRRWVPGYWETVDDGFRWVSGFWAEETNQELGYLPEPPRNIDRGPSGPAPADNFFYVPGNWEYRDAAYVWRAGYWLPRVANRVWIPACYVWTPRGYIYCSGYWDYPFDARGVLYAPICYRSPIYLQPNYCYYPTCTINTGFSLLVHLFFRPGHCHYYFGDWYSVHHHRNYCAWVDIWRYPRHYDPLCAYYSHPHARYKGVNAWLWCRDRHRFYADHGEFRPKPTLRAQTAFVKARALHVDAKRNKDPFQGAVIGGTLKDLAHQPGNANTFKSLVEVDRNRIKKSAQSLTELTNRRRTLETSTRKDDLIRLDPKTPLRSANLPARGQSQTTGRAKTNLADSKGVQSQVLKKPNRNLSNGTRQASSINSTPPTPNRLTGSETKGVRQPANFVPSSTESTASTASAAR